MKNNCPKYMPNRLASLSKTAFLFANRFIHNEAASGIILVLSTVIALVLANSPYAEIYEQFWNYSLAIEFAGVSFARNLHSFVNDVLMTIFFLVAGMEIRREMHDGALSQLKLALLPLIAAIGGVCCPAIIYISFNYLPQTSHGWAVPTATDIAFAMGILALLGRSVPTDLKIILLALAVIDDIIAIMIIALFYSDGFNIYGLPIVFCAILLVFAFHRMKITSAWYYVVPAAILWAGLMVLGIHPSLAGVILGLLTPVIATPPASIFSHIYVSCASPTTKTSVSKSKLKRITPNLPLDQDSKVLQLPPITRVQMALNPWVQFLIMPLFALANAGINFSNADFTANSSVTIILGIGGGLVFGKPIGIFVACFLAVKSNLCRLPPRVDKRGLLLIGFLGGIGFTMAIFTAMLSFNDVNQLEVAKLAILIGSFLSAMLGLSYGLWYCHFIKHHYPTTKTKKEC